MGRRPSDKNHSKISFDPPPTVMKIKRKINKWDLIKLKSCCAAMETINKTKIQPSEWEKICAKEPTDKGLIFKMYKLLTQLNIEKKIKKWAEDLNRYSSKEETNSRKAHKKTCNIFNQFSSVQSLSRVRLFATPWITARQASLSITNSRSSLKLMSIESGMPSSHLILCRPL